MITLTLPWPNRKLFPNGSHGHWAPKADVKKGSRINAAWIARASGIETIKADRLHVSMTFYPPDNRRRDLDNMIAATKAHRDGIADVVGIDDSRWSLSFSKAAPEPPLGRVLVEISPA